MKNNIFARNPLVYHAEVAIVLYGEDLLPSGGHKGKSQQGEKLMEFSRSSKKMKIKLEINKLLKKHFTHGIWKLDLYLRFRCLASLFIVCTSELSKDNKV